MKQIGSLFEKYKQQLKPPQSSVESEVRDVILTVTGITLTPSETAYNTHTRTVQINCASIIKTEIMRQKPTVLMALQKSLGSSNAPTQLL